MAQGQKVSTSGVTTSLTINKPMNYMSGGKNITLDAHIIRQYINTQNGITDQEIMTFMQICMAQELNPYLCEIYLIKYSASHPASIVVGKETFLKRAKCSPEFNGLKAGIIIEKDENLIYREGSFYIKGTEKLLGGWAEVYCSGDQTFRNEVSLDEYKGKAGIWQEKTATMIRKVALCQSLREAFPSVLGGLYSAEEIKEVDPSQLDRNPINVTNSVEQTKEPNTEPKPNATIETATSETVQAEIVNDDYKQWADEQTDITEMVARFNAVEDKAGEEATYYRKRMKDLS